MRNMQHTFYDDNILIDLRFLVAAETWEDADDATVFGLGALLEVGGTAQRLSTLYATRADRDTAFGRLLALHQTFEAHVHAPTEDDDA
jgi:hypothetical protein